VSIAAGPVGRNAEAAGVASLKSVAGVFSYSKTKGLFAGVSLEGSGIIERRDANEKMYGRRWTARELLSGQVAVPPAAEPLLRVLNSRVFSGVAGAQAADAMYNDIPVYDDAHEDVIWEGRRGSAMGEGVRTDRTGSIGAGGRGGPGAGFGGFGGVRNNRSGSMGAADNDYEYRDKPTPRPATWTDDVYDRPPQNNGGGGGLVRSFTTRANPGETFDRMDNREGRARASSGFTGNDYSFGDRKPGRPTAPKPVFGAKRAGMGPDQAIAKFTFDPDQPGDLGFKKGDVITVLKKTDNETDWWTGKVGDREGIFPRYVDHKNSCTEPIY
jgi:hypothetical protein